jgi:hypothetical protein
MMREGSTPMSRTCWISLWEAQSKPTPSDARNRKVSGAGLHLMANMRLAKKPIIGEECSMHTVIRLYFTQVGEPLLVLARDLAEICNEEGLFVVVI